MFIIKAIYIESSQCHDAQQSITFPNLGSDPKRKLVETDFSFIFPILMRQALIRGILGAYTWFRDLYFGMKCAFSELRVETNSLAFVFF